MLLRSNHATTRWFVDCTILLLGIFVVLIGNCKGTLPCLLFTGYIGPLCTLNLDFSHESLSYISTMMANIQYLNSYNYFVTEFASTLSQIHCILLVYISVIYNVYKNVFWLSFWNWIQFIYMEMVLNMKQTSVGLRISPTKKEDLIERENSVSLPFYWKCIIIYKIRNMEGH